MKKTYLINLAVFFTLLTFIACTQEKPMKEIVEESLNFSAKQYALMSEVMLQIPDSLPKTLNTDGKLILADSRWWTSGFFPGSLWYIYEYTKDDKFKKLAQTISKRVEREKFTTDNHDVGFMIYCSFGNGLRLTKQESYNEVIATAAKSLCTRFNPKVGLIKSWDKFQSYKYPVIIDNMMNLELLMWAFKHTGDSSFYKIAVSHADNTIKNHYRSDNSCYHVVCYDTISGQPIAKKTAQGYSDESAWARGQAWGLYGYTTMYRETKLERYLKQARLIADFIINHPNMPADKIPYWDFNAPNIPQAKRDASAAAVMASALLELSEYTDENTAKKYLTIAETQIRSLSSPAYRAELGKNGNFILMHSVGSIPGNSEVDVPLTYADYYFLEALMRYKNLHKS
jgi:unsaturated chondroitin disaccharide hydrolase